jgi:hypothetical protein
MGDKKLPDGKTCADCAHINRCKGIGYSWPERNECDFSPSRYQPPLPDIGKVKDNELSLSKEEIAGIREAAENYNDYGKRWLSDDIKRLLAALRAKDAELEKERRATEKLAVMMEDGDYAGCPNMQGITVDWCDWKDLNELTEEEQHELDPYEEGRCSGENAKCNAKWAREET